MTSIPSRTQSRPLTAYFLLTLATLCWAGNFTVGRYLHESIPPVALNLWRWVVACALVVPLAWPGIVRERAAILRSWKLLTLLALTGVALFQTFVYLALSETEAINAALYLSLTPVLIVALSWGLLGERLSARQALGIAVSLIGAGAVITRGDPSAIAELRFNRGDLWMLAAPPTWALYSVLLRRKPPEIGPLTLLAVTGALGLAMLVPACLWETARTLPWQPRAQTLAGIAYVGVFASVVAFLAWNRGVASIGPNRAGLFLHLIPLFAALLGIAVLGERLQAFHAAGAAFIVTGIWMTKSGDAKR